MKGQQVQGPPVTHFFAGLRLLGGLLEDHAGAALAAFAAAVGFGLLHQAIAEIDPRRDMEFANLGAQAPHRQIDHTLGEFGFQAGVWPEPFDHLFLADRIGAAQHEVHQGHNLIFGQFDGEAGYRAFASQLLRPGHAYSHGASKPIIIPVSSCAPAVVAFLILPAGNIRKQAIGFPWAIAHQAC